MALALKIFAARLGLALTLAAIVYAFIIAGYIFSDVVFGNSFIGQNGDWSLYLVGVFAMAAMVVFPIAYVGSHFVSQEWIITGLTRLTWVSTIILVSGFLTLAVLVNQIAHGRQILKAVVLMTAWGIVSLGFSRLVLSAHRRSLK